MTPELQRAQDMLAAMQAQRDNALNAMVMAQAELAARDRELARLREKLDAPTAQVAQHGAQIEEAIKANGTKGAGSQEYSDSDAHPGVAV